MSLKFTPLFLLGSYAFAGTPDTYVRSDSPAFDTLNQAAQAALQNAVYDSRMQGFEYGGAIIQVGNKFYYTYPVTIGDPLKVEFTIPKRMKPKRVMSSRILLLIRVRLPRGSSDAVSE